MDYQHAIPLAIRHPELARPVDDHVGDANCLQLGVLRPSDVSDLEEFLDCR